MNWEQICYGCFREKPDASPVCPYCGFNEEEEQPFLSLPMGTLLNGRYMLGKVLGVGGFGITYLGFDMTLEIKVAIKEYMPSGMATRHSDRYTVALTGRVQEEFKNGMERFLDEARILAKLQNTPNIVSVQNYFKENGTAYFVMEYIDGMSLKEYLASQGGKISYEQTLKILMPVMQALTRVHGLNLTHRDISPDNISITSGGESKLLDFGAARFSVGDEKSVSVILKHGYAPEEQYSSRGKQGPWTDVYAMGATMYRCITGELPPDSIMRVHNDTLKKPTELGIILPQYVEQAIMKALSVKAEERFPSMEAFIDAITEKASGSTHPHVMDASVRQKTVPGAKKEEKAKSRQMSKGLKITIVVLCVIIWVCRILDAVIDDRTPTGGEPKASVSDTSDISLQEPSGVKEVSLTEYSDEYLNITMGLPEGYTESDSRNWTFTSAEGSSTLEIGFYVNAADFPVYTLANIEDNAEKYVQYYFGTLSDVEATGYRILSKGYRQIGDAQAYQIRFSATESIGSNREFLAVFFESQNGFGCYTVTGSYIAGDETAQAEIWAAQESFIINGPSGSLFKVFLDERVPFRFVYWDDEETISCTVTDDHTVSMTSTQYEDVTVNVTCQPLEGKLTKETWMDGMKDELTASSFEVLNERWKTESGGIEWIVDDYSYPLDGGKAYIHIYCGETDGYVFMVILGVPTEEDAFNAMLLDVTRTIRPVG